jgi:signal transduction histidine kinase
VRHAKARHLWLELREQGGEVLLEVRDDGIGFDVNALRETVADVSNLGLLGMQEHVRLEGGQVEIISEPGKGSTVRARFPLAYPSLTP